MLAAVSEMEGVRGGWLRGRGCDRTAGPSEGRPGSEAAGDGSGGAGGDDDGLHTPAAGLLLAGCPPASKHAHAGSVITSLPPLVQDVLLQVLSSLPSPV